VRRVSLAALGLLIAGGSRLVPAQAPTQPKPAVQQPQPGNGEARGRVLEIKSQAPIAKASITIRAKADAAVIAGAIAGPDGSFRVQGLRPGTYSLRVTYIGFTPHVREFAVTSEAPVANVGAIELSQVAVKLEGVAVNEERATVTIEPDRNSYKAKDVAPAAGNASEVLDAVPSVQVDGDGKVSLRGNENVAVQINGRPSPIRGSQLGAYLKGLPANIVERVEVIPNPSAKYDPEGMAGIINIVLKQNTDLGLSVGVNAAAAEADRYNASTNVGYQRGPLSSFTNVGVMNDQRAVVGINDRERYDAVRSLLSVTDQDIASTAANTGRNFSSSVDYRLNPRDVLSNALTVNHRGMKEDALSAYSELNSARVLTDRYDRPRDFDTKGWMADYNIAFKRTFVPRKHELSTEARYNWTHDEDHTVLWRQTPVAITSATTIARLDGEDDKTDAVGKQLTAQLDYMKAFALRTKLESGWKSTARWLDRDFTVLKDAMGSGTWVSSNLSNAFEFDEQVHAVYGVLSQGVGKFDLQGGLRAERATRDFTMGTTAQHYPYTYNSVFPSGVVMYNMSDANQMKASYSRRIRRPGTQELNPFPSFFDAQNVMIGNPSLNPEYTDAIELGYTRTMSRGTLQFAPFYRHTSNIIRVDINTTDVIDGREVTSVSFKNLATSNSWGSDLTGSLRWGTKFNGFAALNVFKMVTDGGSTSLVGSDAVTWSGRVNGSSQLTPTLMVQGSYFYRAPMKIERGQFSAMQMTTFAIRKKVDGDKAAVMLRYTDPFNTNVFRIRAGDDKVMQVTERNFGVRSLFLGFQYNYGQTPKVRQPTQEQQQGGGFGPPG
jgi:outer membrane receptor protein involved in Fe transport